MLATLAQIQHSFCSRTLACHAGVRKCLGRGSAESPWVQVWLHLAAAWGSGSHYTLSGHNLLSRKVGTEVFSRVKVVLWHAPAQLWVLSACSHQQACANAWISHTVPSWLQRQKNMLRVNFITWLLGKAQGIISRSGTSWRLGKVLLMPSKGPRAMKGCTVDRINPQIFRESVAGEESCSELILWKQLRDNYEGTVIAHFSHPRQHSSTNVPMVNTNWEVLNNWINTK